MLALAFLLNIIFLQLSFAIANAPPAQLFSNSISAKVLATFNSLPNPLQYPQYTDSSAGKWQYFVPDTWTSGFFPATGYALNTRKILCSATPTNGLGSGDWLTLARASTSGLLSLEVSNDLGHDVGFISYPFVEELIVNPTNQTAIDGVNKFATLLANRFNPIVGCTESWDSTDPSLFQVIIDNMMNLEVLFHSEALTGNETLRNIAISHADTTIANHIRADGSTWHVIDYNSFTGAVTEKTTAQGYSANSTWSRGQAWGIYGFANMYKFTNDSKYLDTSRRLATYFLNNIPSDGIIPWDFNAPVAGRPADSSAATIAATALLLLAQQETSPSAAQPWIDAAVQILSNLTALAWNPSWQSLLSNGTVNEPTNIVSTGIVYGDYYYIKAGNELISMGLANCTQLNVTTSSSAASLPSETSSSTSGAYRLAVPLFSAVISFMTNI